MKDLQELLKNKVSSYEFENLYDENREEGIRNFEFKKFSDEAFQKQDDHKKVIKLERDVAKKNNFDIAPIVREHRGINAQEEHEHKRLIQEEVERELAKVRDEAYKEGFAKGHRDGTEEVYRETRAGVEQKMEAIGEMVDQVLRTQAELLHQEKIAVYKTIRNLTKWIILKELKDDGQYVMRLLEKLTSELQTKSNLLIQIDPKSFEDMPDILDDVKEILGSLENTRIECDYDIEGPGIVVESNNGIINGSLKEQFKSLNKIFHSVGLTEHEDFSAGEYFEEVNINELPKNDSSVETPESSNDSSVEDDEDSNES